MVLPTFVLEALEVSSKPSLPINITQTLPHILLTLGTNDGTFHPSIPAIVDTGAALNGAYSGYIMPITKAYMAELLPVTLSFDPCHTNMALLQRPGRIS